VDPAEEPIHFTITKLQINPFLQRAYEAFSAGNMEAARSEYALLLNGEPKNGQALMGMAAISLRLGQPKQAEEYYLRAIEADPKDALAQSGLIALRGQADLPDSESRLKNLIAAQPALPTLHFVLGNLYARQGRWNEAQQEYFIAHGADRENPDVIFNLAVSLDRLHQPVLAAQFYSQALAASANRSAGFDAAQVNARLHDLSLVPN
jgi:Tfp pilus assembly protein PilF